MIKRMSKEGVSRRQHCKIREEGRKPRREGEEGNAKEHHVLSDLLSESTVPNGQVIKYIDSKADGMQHLSLPQWWLLKSSNLREHAAPPCRDVISPAVCKSDFGMLSSSPLCSCYHHTVLIRT